MKKLAVASVAFTLLFAGCLGGDDGDIDINSDDPGANQDILDQLVINAEAGADGSYTFSVPQLPGLSYQWELGDLTTATGASVTHQYMVDSGTFSVVLTAMDAKSNKLHVAKTITIGEGGNANPTAAFSFDGPFVEVGTPFTVDASATSDPDGDALAVSWYLAAPSDEPAEADGGGGAHAHHSAGTTLPNPDEGHDHGDAAAAEGEHAHGGGLDTGNILPGEAAELTFMNAGTYQMHCHPHPWMVSHVNVVPDAALEATVTMVGSAYVPAVVDIAPGGKVTYVNSETQEGLFHTATQSAFAPFGEKLPLTDFSGEVSIDTEGEYDLVLVVQDGKGQLGVTKKRVYAVTEVPESTFEATYNGTYDASVTSSAAGQTNAKQHPFEIDFPGHAVISADFEAQTGDLNFRLLDATGKELTRGLNMEAMLEKGRYTIEVVPDDPGLVAQATYTIDVLVHLDLSGGAQDDTGGGGGHHH